jgi:predicted RecA/RadA family phage recombinase
MTMQAVYFQEGNSIDYTPNADVAAGSVVLLGNIPGIANRDIPANTLGALQVSEGVFKVVKDASVFAQGDPVYWNPTGDPTGGTAGSGCCTSTATGTYLMGYATAAALTGDAVAYVELTPASLTNTMGGTPGASTAAAGSTTSDAGVLPAGTSRVYPTTGADDTKGVRIHASDKVTGRMLFIGNGVSNKILKVYPPSGGAINGASADAAFSSASGKGVLIVCLSSGSNTWLAL